ncbi:MAG: hypothetical protein IJX33_08135 [Akkermansia sp.]|nr:hypothetical protein [Akkermansia sp.]
MSSNAILMAVPELMLRAAVSESVLIVLPSSSVETPSVSAEVIDVVPAMLSVLVVEIELVLMTVSVMLMAPFEEMVPVPVVAPSKISLLFPLAPSIRMAPV